MKISRPFKSSQGRSALKCSEDVEVGAPGPHPTATEVQDLPRAQADAPGRLHGPQGALLGYRAAGGLHVPAGCGGQDLVPSGSEA